MTTPKSLRSAPSRTFENYILTSIEDVDAGLTKIPQEKFAQIPGSAGLGGADDGYSDEIEIGFPFSFDGRIHKKFRISPNGWMILLDPANPIFAITDVMVNTYENSRINSTFLKNHVLLAPWFDDIKSVYAKPEDITGPYTPSAARIESYNRGLSPEPLSYVNPRKFGVRYANDNTSEEGRRLIVRWNSMSDFAVPFSSIIRYEIVLYENGKIEYRYAPRVELTFGPTNNEDATIGIFMPGGTWRFRDFSYEIGYQTGGQRFRYKLGGAVSGSYTETKDSYTVPYAVGLNPQAWWPAQGKLGVTLSFQPPLNRRKVLPRLSLREKDSRLKLPTVARTGDSRSGADSIFFDDRKSLMYRKSGVVINYPTTLPRFYASNINAVALNQNLFTGDFEVTGGISKSAVQEYLEDNTVTYIAPFTENKLFENDPGADTDAFFLTGSSTTEVGEGFKQPLKSKTQIKLSFRVDHKTLMLPTTSSIYYFNSKIGRWQYPTASFVNGSDIGYPDTEAGYGRLIETDRGFNAFGFNLTSGSVNRGVTSSATDPHIGKLWSKENEIDSLISTYNKSIQNNQDYNASSDESFTIPIQQPFLLEKAVIELPIEAGPGWFNDKTRCFIPLTTNSPPIPNSITPGGYFGGLPTCFDVGGPGVTVALFNQISIGSSERRRDLILSSTITHHLDNTAEIVFSNTPNVPAGSSLSWISHGGSEGGKIWQVTPQGFNAFSTPGCIVTGKLNNSKYFYTGSVTLKCRSEISNGLLIKDFFNIPQAFTGSGPPNTQAALDAITTLFSSSVWRIGDDSPLFSSTPGNRNRTINSINNFGRGGSGFQPSGRSILGKEYVTTQGKDIVFYDNPFYLYKNVTTAADIQSRISLGNPGQGNSIVYAYSLTSRQRSIVSPYLLFPGDRLVLSVSKTRPVFFSNLSSQPHTSGSVQHDIKLTTGSINITLYGSLVSNGQEFHDTLNQSLASDAVHEVVVGGTKTW
jgi:hypothetical protein